MKYAYSDFNIENHGITFGCDDEKNVLISIPFADDTPQCIKDKLNEVINSGIEEWLRLRTYGDGISTVNMPEPKDLLLNARIQINYDHELGARYYIAVTITGLMQDDEELLIDKDVLVLPQISTPFVLQNEVIAYCRYKLDMILLPSWRYK